MKTVHLGGSFSRARGVPAPDIDSKLFWQPLTPGLPDLFLFLLQLGLESLTVTDELFFQLFNRLAIAFIYRFGNFAFDENFAISNLRFVDRFQFGDFFLLLFSEFGRRRRFAQSLHRKFIGGFHNSIVSGSWLVVSSNAA